MNRLNLNQGITCVGSVTGVTSRAKTNEEAATDYRRARVNSVPRVRSSVLVSALCLVLTVWSPATVGVSAWENTCKQFKDIYADGQVYYFSLSLSLSLRLYSMGID